ncbi:hypothetical protein ABQF35_29750 [Mycobacterium syngnathidarum]
MFMNAPGSNASDWALNGSFVATSIGDWATKNGVYEDAASARDNWKIAMTCADVVTCSGTVVSGAGWSADITTTNGEYVVKRLISDWQTCLDGSVSAGHQLFRFFPVDADGAMEPGSTVFGGYLNTAGDSGACGVNKSLQIDMPFRLDKIE